MDRPPAQDRTPDWGPGTKPTNQEYLDTFKRLRYTAAITFGSSGNERGVLNVENTCDQLAVIIFHSAQTIAAGVGKKFAANELRTLADTIDPPTTKGVPS